MESFLESADPSRYKIYWSGRRLHETRNEKCDCFGVIGLFLANFVHADLSF